MPVGSGAHRPHAGTSCRSRCGESGFLGGGLELFERLAFQGRADGVITEHLSDQQVGPVPLLASLVETGTAAEVSIGCSVELPSDEGEVHVTVCQVQDQAQLQGRRVAIAVRADDGVVLILGPFQSLRE